MLEIGGYAVLSAFDGEEALRICAERDGRIDLLLTDTVMPKMNGSELIEAMKIAHPAIPALLMSGYSGDSLLQRGILPPDTAFIGKPFLTQALCMKVTEMLERVMNHEREKGG